MVTDHETPQSRIREVGASALSDAELLAILFRNGTSGMSAMQLAQKVLIEHGGWRGLQRVDAETLCQSYGIGDARAAILKASLELARRLLLAEQIQRMQIKSPTDAAQLLMLEMSHLDQEHLRTVLLDTKNRVQAITTIYVGSLNTSMVRVGEVFKDAVRRNSAAVIIVHNHPSGDRAPRSAR